MSSISKWIKETAKQMCIDELRQRAKGVQKEILKGAKSAMELYYSYPEGYYERTGMFGDSYSPIYEEHIGSIKSTYIKVGVRFEADYEYARHSKNYTTADIYSWNFEQGAHGWGKVGEIPEGFMEGWIDGIE